MPSDLERTARAWNAVAERGGKDSGLCWWDAGPEIHKRINRKISGDPTCDYTTYVLRKYFAKRLPVDYCLSLGCGSGSLERSLACQGVFLLCDACDIAEAQLVVAKKLAEQEGITNINYYVADVNKITLTACRYDVAWMQGAMHHVKSLEHVCYQIAQALKPEGLLILKEYIGPSRYQFAARQKEVANLCLRLLPARYRAVVQEAAVTQAERSLRSLGVRWFASRLLDKIKDGDLLNTIQRRFRARKSRMLAQAPVKMTCAFPSVRDVIAADPSEAVRSEEIETILSRHFEILETKELGGNILQFLLADIAGNFSRQDEESQALLRMLIQVEETLLSCGEFRSDFAFIVGRTLIKQAGERAGSPD